MTHEPATRRAAAARALKLSLAVARQAGWRFEIAGPALSMPFAGYLYVDSARLLLVPTAAGLTDAVRLVEAAVREARSHALIVSTADSEPAFALGLWERADTRWHVPVTPWLGADGKLWMVTRPLSTAAPEVAGTSFPLEPNPARGLAAPWHTEDERRAGERRATTWQDALR
ncbi:hypothetical protein [Sphingomonas sp. Ag1]|jgi:hypothetical protein|uniref:hypothetical protein n=1 Tax=Sphingomonas sp. Ag1 TaxID=1642949 RepID=UPI000A52B3BD|nr:hypothetical protein [Sphingomonas sp. Ag1]